MVTVLLFFTKTYIKEYNRWGKNVQLHKRYFNIELLFVPVWTWDLFLKSVEFEVNLTGLWMKEHLLWAVNPVLGWKTPISQNLLLHPSHFSPLCILMSSFSCPHFSFCILLSLIYCSWLKKLPYFSTLILSLLWYYRHADTFLGRF